jgi:hypothetical protein
MNDSVLCEAGKRLLLSAVEDVSPVFLAVWELRNLHQGESSAQLQARAATELGELFDRGWIAIGHWDVAEEALVPIPASEVADALARSETWVEQEERPSTLMYTSTEAGDSAFRALSNGGASAVN